MSPVQQLLHLGKKRYPELSAVFDHAIVLAREAEYRAKYTSDLAMTHVSPKYEPLVDLLADAVDDNLIKPDD